MSNDHSLVIQLYWGGKIVYAEGSMLYDPPMPKKVLFLRERVGFEELVNRVYNIMNLDKNRFKITLIFRNCLQHGMFGAMPLVDDDGIDGMYFLKANSGHATEIYVEVEEVSRLEEHDTQANPIASSQLDRGTSLCGPVPIDMARTVDLHGSQSTQLDYGDVQPTRRGRRRGSGRRRVDNRPSSNQAEVHMSSAEFRSATNDANRPHMSTSDPDQGPIDPTLLYLQQHHRSAAIFRGEGDIIDIKRCDKHFWMFKKNPDPRVQQYIDIAGFGGVLRVGSVKLDHGLITAFIERWRQETHTFHLPLIGEATITLQDVEVLWGLRVDGLPVTLVHLERSKFQRKQLVYELLGFWPEDNHFREARLKMACLYERLSAPLPPDAPDDMVRQYARMYILILLGGQLFADTCGNVAHLNWLDYLRDLEAMRHYSWGSAVLACLYRRMCHACLATTKVTAGPYMLLQLWAWERFPTIRPTIAVPRQAGDYPRDGRWATKRTGVDAPQHVASYYRDQLSLLRPDQFIWMPYIDNVLSALPSYCTAGANIWRAKVPLIYWHIVELHVPDRVMRQFGMRQDIPPSVDTDAKGLHQLGLSGFPGRDWTQFHSDWIGYWNGRAQSVISGEPTDILKPSNEYLKWYHCHTILYITPPIHQVQHDGHQGVSGQFEYLMSSMHRIGQQSMSGLQQDDLTQTFHPALMMIRDEAFGSMQYLQRFDRMAVGPSQQQDSSTSTSHSPYQRPARHVPNQAGRSSRRGKR